MTTLLQQLKASPEKRKTGHRVVLCTDEMCTNSVQTDVSGFRRNLSRAGWWIIPERRPMRKLSTVIYTHFIMNVELSMSNFTLISFGYTYCFQEVHWFHWKHHFKPFYFLSKTFFLPFTCVHFCIKITNLILTYCPLLFFSLALLDVTVLLGVKADTVHITVINHMMSALVTLVMK